ncbi:MAG: CopG family transcriptional regulator [Balneolaceae bacterium]|nr:MAG: CopG family transcriptional regulator [Balneolaceae bacterium]
MKAKDFDKKFDDGENVAVNLNLAEARRPYADTKRANVDFPEWMVNSPDREAKRLGVSRQSVIKMWLAERLEKI